MLQVLDDFGIFGNLCQQLLPFITGVAGLCFERTFGLFGSIRETSVPLFTPVLYAAMPSASARKIAAAKGIQISRQRICEGR